MFPGVGNSGTRALCRAPSGMEYSHQQKHQNDGGCFVRDHVRGVADGRPFDARSRGL